MRGLQIGRGLRFSNRRKDQEPPEVEHRFEVLAGVRYFQLQDYYAFVGTDGTLGNAWQNTSRDNVSIGPQVGIRWNSRGSNWSIGANGDLLLGYHDTEGVQVAGIGHIRPIHIATSDGSLIVFSPNSVYYHQESKNLSPLGEFDVSTSYQLTSTLTFRLGYNVFYAGNLQYVDASDHWTLPNLGLIDAPGHDEFQKTVYANIELLR